MQNTEQQTTQLDLDAMLEEVAGYPGLTQYADLLNVIRQALPGPQVDLPATTVVQSALGRIESWPFIGRRLSRMIHNEMANAVKHRAHAHINQLAILLDGLKRFALAYTTSLNAGTHDASSITTPLRQFTDHNIDQLTNQLRLSGNTLTALSSASFANPRASYNARLSKYRDDLVVLLENIQAGNEGTVLKVLNNGTKVSVKCNVSNRMPLVPVQLANDPNIYDLHSLIKSVNFSLSRGRDYICPSTPAVDGEVVCQTELWNIRYLITDSPAIDQAVSQLCETDVCAERVSVAKVSLDALIERSMQSLLGDVQWPEDDTRLNLSVCPITQNCVRVPVQIEGCSSVFCITSLKNIFHLLTKPSSVDTSGVLSREPGGVFYMRQCLVARDEAVEPKPEVLMSKVILPKNGATATQQETILAAKLSAIKRCVANAASSSRRPVSR